ncbi:MAG TPA: hypothetical protein VGI45_34970 [Terracidiphilus sp.]|jgi:hypothetical protein
MPEIVLPPLTPKEIAARDYQENLLGRGLEECWHGDDFDAERAEKLARAYAVEIFNTIHTFYRTKVGYRAEWLPEIVREAVLRVLTVYGDHHDQGVSQMGTIAENTVMEHLRTVSTSERGWSEFNQAFPARRDVFDPLPGDAPLLKMVKEHHARTRRDLTPNPQPEAAAAPVPDDGTVIGRRAALLDEYQRTTRVNDYQIYNALKPPIHKSEFYDWKKGKLPDTSKTTKRFEAFLKAKKKPIRKTPTS